VKSSLVTRIVEHWGLTLKRRRQGNISGVYDGMLPGEEFLDLSDAFPGYDPAHLLFQVLRDTCGDRLLVHAHASFVICRSHFAILLGKIKDGQNLPTVTYFGGTTIMARYEAIERVRGHTKVYWTVKKIIELNDLVASGRNVTEIASHFDTTVEELERDFRKLRKQATSITKPISESPFKYCKNCIVITQ
jgi:hypothetical protein